MANLYSAPTGIPESATPNKGILAPSPSFPERVGTYYERKQGANPAGNQGPARFYEGLASDTDLPNEFSTGAMQGYETAPGRPNQNKNVYEKWPAETMRERAHVGSASWVEAPTYLGEFSHGTDTVLAERKYEEVVRGSGLGRRWERRSPAEIND
jgi:hypothetical protein